MSYVIGDDSINLSNDIMDYEKKYFDAIERLKQWDKEHPNGYVVSDRDKFIFPELVESEDEKIRKELTDFIKRKFENSCSPTPSKNILANWIAYLEKQGDIEAYQSRWGKSNGYLAEPVIEKKCMYSDDNYTNEDRKVLCDGCEEDCKYAQKKGPVSEDLEKAADKYCNNICNIVEFTEGDSEEEASDREYVERAFKAGAQWQKEKIMAKAIDAKLLEGHLIRQKGVTHPLHVGDKVKVIVIKED